MVCKVIKLSESCVVCEHANHCRRDEGLHSLRYTLSCLKVPYGAVESVVREYEKYLLF